VSKDEIRNVKEKPERKHYETRMSKKQGEVEEDNK
jgi:hypothetical protein